MRHKSTKIHKGIYLLLDPEHVEYKGSPRESITYLLGEALKAGVRVFQLRAKRMSDEQMLELAQSIMPIISAHHAQLIINDRVHIAKQVYAHGLHIGQNDMSAHQARSILGEHAIIGLSTHSIEQAQYAHHTPIDYVAIGPVFTTKSKEHAPDAVGMACAQHVIAHSKLPVVVIGGITLSNIESLSDIHAQHVALIRAISMSRTPFEHARTLQRTLMRKQHIQDTNA